MIDGADVTLMVVYMYAAGSPFEEMMNLYMSSSKAINPYDLLPDLMAGNSINSTGRMS